MGETYVCTLGCVIYRQLFQLNRLKTLKNVKKKPLKILALIINIKRSHGTDVERSINFRQLVDTLILYFILLNKKIINSLFPPQVIFISWT